MIIDIHRHTLAPGWMTPAMWQVMAKTVAAALSSRGRAITAEQAAKKVLPDYCDATGEVHLARMDRAGIDKTVMFVFDVGPELGDTRVTVEQQNQVVFDIARRHPGRIIPFVGIDPRREGAVDFFCRMVEEQGAKGLKLHPGAGFDPKSPEALELAARAERDALPVLIHTGPNAPPSSSQYASPKHLIPMLERFPKLKVIAAHLAFNHRPELLAMAPDWPNLFTDISAWQQAARDNYTRFAQTIHQAVRAFGARRVLFGTDAPYRWPNLDDHEYVAAVRDLGGDRAGEWRLDDEEVEMVLGGNVGDWFQRTDMESGI
jgi:predicted TIM-barrel fold metal-dependent hydrolase